MFAGASFDSYADAHEVAVLHSRFLSPSDMPENNTFSIEDIERSLNSLKSGKAPGINKISKEIRHDQFLNVLKTLKPTPSTFRSFQSTNHVLRTVEINKTCLNAFDDKRYILQDGVGTLSYGHFRAL